MSGAMSPIKLLDAVISTFTEYENPKAAVEVPEPHVEKAVVYEQFFDRDI
jgi:hypothetical protein